MEHLNAIEAKREFGNLLIKAQSEPVNKYNTQRTHSGKHCYGKTPTQTFLNSKHIALDKNIPSFVNECQASDTRYLSHSNYAVR